MNYLVKIEEDTQDIAAQRLIYLRRVDTEDVAGAIRIIDDALSRKPRAKRSDAGRSRTEAK